ncbi:uncharacterized protein [Clytia hemisphaerica]|uniref:Uncharacterized protein n=1 Tax=Clytia hemisphaerica TaxID=252671 RepID=A0A7M6DRM7_9CNID
MRLKVLRNILITVLFTFAFIHLVRPTKTKNNEAAVVTTVLDSTSNALDAATVNKAKKASTVAGQLTEVSSKASKFSAVLNTGLTQFSTYVYGVTATMAVINILWPGTFPEGEPAHVAEMRAYFEELKAEFRVVKNQINDLKLYVQERSTDQVYAGYILSIHTMELYFQEYTDSSDALREAYGESFAANYDQLGNHADHLYTGLVITNDNLNIAKNAISYTKGDRSKVLKIMFELFNVINMGIKHEALYYRLKDDTEQIDVLADRWATRMNNLQNVMKAIDDEIVKGAKEQMETDLDENVVELKNNDNQVMSENLYTFFSEKYYWKDWVVIVYSKSVKGHDNHAYSYCSNNAVFRMRLGNGVDKTMYLFHIDKASGSWMTKTQAKNILKTGPYTYKDTCYHGRVRYTCDRPQNDLSKTIDAVKDDLKVCSVTKGIVILKKDKGYGIAPKVANRIRGHFLKGEFNAFVIGPWGSSSPQESVEGVTINGGWTSYTDWTSCSQTCGGGTQTRRRYCRNPVAQDGGRVCSGQDTQSKSCNTFSCFSKTFLTDKIEKIMSSKKSLDNEKFAEHLRDQLKTTYPEYRFSVNTYNSISGSDKHSMQGYHYVNIFRKHGRNVVVAFTKKTNSVPNSSTLKAIEERIVEAIKNKGKDAKKSRELAWTALKKEGYRVAMVLVVRFGNGLRSRSTGGGIFFENFNSSGSHKSSLVVMLGKA